MQARLQDIQDHPENYHQTPSDPAQQRSMLAMMTGNSDPSATFAKQAKDFSAVDDMQAYLDSLSTWNSTRTPLTTPTPETGPDWKQLVDNLRDSAPQKDPNAPNPDAPESAWNVPSRNGSGNGGGSNGTGSGGGSTNGDGSNGTGGTGSGGGATSTDTGNGSQTNGENPGNNGGGTGLPGGVAAGPGANGGGRATGGSGTGANRNKPAWIVEFEESVYRGDPAIQGPMQYFENFSELEQLSPYERAITLNQGLQQLIYAQALPWKEFQKEIARQKLIQESITWVEPAPGSPEYDAMMFRRWKAQPWAARTFAPGGTFDMAISAAGGAAGVGPTGQRIQNTIFKVGASSQGLASGLRAYPALRYVPEPLPVLPRNAPPRVQVAIVTPTNRGGLRSAMGPAPAGMTNPNVHHDLPWSLRQKFAQLGLNVNDPQYGRWVQGTPPGGHQRWSSAFEAEWTQFFDRNLNATADDVIMFMNQLRADPRFQ